MTEVAGEAAAPAAEAAPGRPAWLNRLSVRQAGASMLAGLAVGAVTSALLLLQDARAERERMRATVAAALALVEPAAARAAYTYDIALAETVAQAVAEIGAATRFTLADNLGRELAAFARPPPEMPLRPLTAAIFGRELVEDRPLLAPPFDGAPPPEPAPEIGRLAAAFDSRQLAAGFLGRSGDMIALGIARAIVVALALTAIFYLMVTRPLVRLAGALARLGPDGEAELALDPRHARDELGLATRSVNALLARVRASRRERAEALRRLEIAAANMPDGLAILDPDGRIGFANARFRADWPGGVPDLGPAAEETEIERLDGRVMRLRARPTPDGGRVLVTTDVTQRRRMAEDLARAERLASLGTLAAGVAHDFSNLLATIQATTEVAIARLEPGHPVREPLEAALAAALRGKGLVEQITTFARAAAAPRERLDLAEAVDATLRLLRPALAGTAELRHARAPAPLPIEANPTQIHQLVANLVTNAAQASPPGAIVEVATAAEPPWATLVVRDRGHGMDAATRRRAFEPFFSTKPPGEGAGLGLAVVHGIVGGLGGEIAIDSVRGAGAAIRVRTPLRADDVRKVESRRLAELKPGSDASAKPLA